MPSLSAPITEKSGALILCVFAVSGPRRRQLLSTGRQPPDPVRVQAVLDTGAQSTCIHERIATKLGLPLRYRIPTHTPHGTASCPVYEASLEIPGVLSLDVVRVVETGLV